MSGIPAHLIPLRDARWDHAEGSLSPTERSRADRFVNELDRKRYVRLRLFTRLHLAELYGAGPHEVELTTARCVVCGSDTHGAPIARIGDQVLTLSLTQSGDVGGLLVGAAAPVGLDIEEVVEPPVFDAIRGVLSAAETSALADARQLDEADALTRAWTRKEAVLKAIGVGFFIDPQFVEVQAESAGRVVASCTAPGWESKWDVQSIRQGSLHVAGAFRHPTRGRLRCIDHGLDRPLA